MAYTYSFDANKTGILRCPIVVKCGAIHERINALLDTGAGICHITYGLWKRWGFNSLLFDSNPSLMNTAGIYSADDIAFDKLPIIKKTSTLGDDKEVDVYEFRLDELMFGMPSASIQTVPFNKITVRIIGSDEPGFIVGWNVLKYLTINYKPSVSSSKCQLTLEQDGIDFMQHDRQNNISNYLQDRFSYLQPKS